MKTKNWHILQTPWFILAVLILLLNDFLLKDYYHNWFTGKLSDFAGVFLLPLFLSVWFPRRIFNLIIFTAGFFIFWKSPYSNFLIEAINTLPGFHYTRIVDYTDLMALSMLPLSYWVYKHSLSMPRINIAPAIPLSVAAFALMATSQEFPSYPLNLNYEIQENRATVTSRIQSDTAIFQNDNFRMYIDSNALSVDTYHFNFFLNAPAMVKSASVYGYMWSIDTAKTGIYLDSYDQGGSDCGFFRRRCEETHDDEVLVQEAIEQYFIDLL